MTKLFLIECRKGVYVNATDIQMISMKGGSVQFKLSGQSSVWIEVGCNFSSGFIKNIQSINESMEDKHLHSIYLSQIEEDK